MRAETTPESRVAIAELEQMQVEQLSHFMVKVMTQEAGLMECFLKAFKGHETTLRGVKEIRVERIIKNHAQMMALIDCLAMVCPLSPPPLLSTLPLPLLPLDTNTSSPNG